MEENSTTVVALVNNILLQARFRVIMLGKFISCLLAWLIDWLIVWCLTPFSTLSRRTVHPPMLSWNSFLPVIYIKPLPGFQHSHCRNNGERWQRNESCRNNYHQSSERILAKPGIEAKTSCSQVLCATEWTLGLGVLYVYMSRPRWIYWNYICLVLDIY